jgi:XTP/dITP diphosphohydrolase
MVLATNNAHKVAELTRILAATGAAKVADVVSLAAYPDAPDVAETGCTFEENALLKARAIAAFAGLPAIADDSGLCVDALNGMPGVLSARWAGSHGDDPANLALVLAQLADVPAARRGARFVCAAALVVPDASAAAGLPRVERVVAGELVGTLATAPRGSHGFGYDPIFVPEGETRTTAEMDPADKDAISHRGRAFRALATLIAELLSAGGAPRQPFSNWPFPPR